MRPAAAWRSTAVRLSALGLLGVLLPLAVLAAALSGFHNVQQADHAAQLIIQAQRYHQDADQAHDAVHSDVLEVLRATDAGGGPDRSAALEVLQADIGQYRLDVDRASHLALPAALSPALARLRPVQLAYADHALGLAEHGTSPGPDGPTLATFTAEFGHLQRAQGQVTEQLSETQAASQTVADAAQRHAVRNVLVAGALALAGVLTLLVLSGSLAQMARRLSALLGRERDVAQTLQRSLLPGPLPTRPGVQLAARFLPSEIGAQVGGDWYDAFALPGGALALIIGDVTGHDVQAASTMGQLRNAFRACAITDTEPADVFDRLNDLMFHFQAEHMATSVYLRLPAYNPGTADPTSPTTVTVVNAGHCPPLVVTPAGKARLLEDEPCLPLGALPDVRYTQHDYQIADGSTLVLYTDGLIERRGQGLDTSFDLLLRPAADASRESSDPETLCARLLMRMSLDQPAADDVALLAVKISVGLADGTEARRQRPSIRSDAGTAADRRLAPWC